MRSHAKSIESGTVLSPWPRKSRAQPWATSASCVANGAQIIPWKPVGWQNTRGEPSPPRSMSASKTPSDEGTCWMGGTPPMLAVGLYGGPTGGANQRR
jgi:hypothetical protein